MGAECSDLRRNGHLAPYNCGAQLPKVSQEQVMDLFWDLVRESEARGAAADPREAIDALNERYDRALLLNAAMWSLLREKLGVTDEDLAVRMNEIDASDGKLDGQIRRPASVCPKCKRKSPSRAKQCIWCGE
jgi:hypothetical protein